MIIDASAAGMFLLPDEPEPPVAMTERLKAGPLLVPQHWGIEVASMLYNAERRRRIDRAGRLLAVHQVASWAARFDPRTNDVVWTETLDLAVSHDLTVYDAAYLELALHSGDDLATNDIDLAEAARASGVTVLTGLP